MAQCTAKSKQSGTRCKKNAVPGREVCEIHGGKSLSGIASPTLTQGGRYSKVLPVRLKEEFERATGDGELLSIREDIALLDSRLSDVLASASNQESGELWQNLKDARRDYLGASGKDKEEKQSDALSRILWLINEGYQEWQAWKDIRFMLQERRQLVESERKRLVDMQQMISAEQANVLILNIVQTVKKHVTDRDALQAISEDIRRLTTHERSGHHSAGTGAQA